MILNKYQLETVSILRKNWNNPNIQKHFKSIHAKLRSENLSIESSWKDIKKCFENVAQPNFCIALAYLLKLNHNPKIKRR